MSGHTDEIFLSLLGERVRERRQALGLSQGALAERSGISPRFVSQVETGRGNISVLRLRQISRALSCMLVDLLEEADAAHRVVALIGLRGAGKSAVGAELARRMNKPFVELDDRIAAQAGLGIGELFAIHGEDYYRRLEREVLREFLRDGAEAVLATGGGLVTRQSTYDLLKQSATTVWLRARPQDHLDRVIAQGDSRPMAGRVNPLGELSSLLEARSALYAEADLVVPTSDSSVEEVAESLVQQLA